MPKGSSGAKRLPNYKKAVVPRDKIRKYYLKPGTKHFREFSEVGYTTKHYMKLNWDILEGLKANDAVVREQTDDVTVYNVYMELGVTSKRTFLTSWEIPKTAGIPRNITAFRKERKKR